MMQNGLGPTTGLETQLHGALMEMCRQAMEWFVNDPDIPVPEDTPREDETYAGERERDMTTLFGRIKLLHRKYFSTTGKRGHAKNPKCKKHSKHTRKRGRFPMDEALCLVNGATPALAARAIEYAADHPYDKAAELFAKAYTKDLTPDILKALVREVSPKAWDFLARAPREPARDVACAVIMADGKGILMRPEELAGVKGRGPDGVAHTREAKIGAFFEMTCVPGHRGQSERLPDSTTYVTTLGRKDAFADMFRWEYLRLWPRPPEVLLYLGDGAPWLWKLRAACFPNAHEILDFYHAAEHLKPLLELAGLKAEAWTKRFEEWKGMLLAGDVDKVIGACEALAVGAAPEKAKEWEKALHYYRENRGRMKYDEYTAKGWFIGSGVVESACKKLVGSRFNQPGMLWTRAGAEAMLPLRTVLLSGRYEKMWDFIVKTRQKEAAA